MKKILMTLTLAFAAMIAIPSVANAQDAKPEQKTECCKEKKDCVKDKKACCKEGKACAEEVGKNCCKEGKACAKEGKACAKEGNCAQRKMKDGKFAKNSHKMKASGEARNIGKEMRRGDGENPMFKGITLSDEQKAKIKSLREQNKTAAKKSKAEAKAKSRDDMKKLSVEFDKEVENILDKDQLKQYKANKAEMDARRAEKQDKLPKLEKKNK